MNKIKTHKEKAGVISIIILAVLLFVPYSYAGTYWVSSTGTAPWSNCGGVTPLSGTAACALSTANTNAVAGDTVYLRGGSYTVGERDASTNQGIKPAASGTSGNVIKYTVYADEVVNLVGQASNGVTSVGINLWGKSYIKVNGKTLGQLNISGMRVSLLIGPWTGSTPTVRSNYNEISYVYVTGQVSSDWIQQGNFLSSGSYNHIHHNKFTDHGWMNPVNSGNHGNLFDLGSEYAATEIKRTSYNVIEYNEFTRAGHATFGMFGDHNVIRNNYFHNEGWFTYTEYPDAGMYGYRNIINDGVPDYVGNSIFEGNRIGHAAPNYTWTDKNGYWGGTGMKVCSPYNILRYNSFFNNSSNALDLAGYPAPTNAYGAYNHIYNNTFYKNGIYLKLPGSDDRYTGPVTLSYTGTGNWAVIYANVFKNNLFYNNGNTNSASGAFWTSGGATFADLINPDKGNVTFANNYNAVAGENTDPQFISESVSYKTSWTLPNLNLQSTSPAIDAASYLTQANGAGSSSTSLVVYDARYFQDGNFGQGSLAWPSSVNMQADWIAIGYVNNVVQIKSINYSTNTITLASPMTWSDNWKIWLYKKSDGAQVLVGIAPDMGSYENTLSTTTSTPTTTPPPPPSNLRLVQ